MQTATIRLFNSKAEAVYSANTIKGSVVIQLEAAQENQPQKGKASYEEGGDGIYLLNHTKDTFYMVIAKA